MKNHAFAAGCLILLFSTRPVSAQIAGAPEEDDYFGRAVTSADYNGDGFDDVAVSADYESISDIPKAGAVHIIYGTAHGLSSQNSQFIYQSASGIEGGSEANDRFGFRLTSGDFNGDGFDDLAVGTPFEAIGDSAEAGAVNVLYGSENGLRNDNDQMFNQGTEGFNETAETGDHFGWALCASDFNRDGYADLAIGVPSEGVGEIEDMGSVNIIYGSGHGLDPSTSESYHQDIEGIGGVGESGDVFGSALSAGDCNGDGFGDLVIGIPGEDIGEKGNAGALSVIYGSAGGLVAGTCQSFNQDYSNMAGMSEANDILGHQLAVGDFNSDGYDDIAASANQEAIGDSIFAGMINVLYGTEAGISTADNHSIYRGLEGVNGQCRTWMKFGECVCTGDFNHDGYSDLAVGIRYDIVDGFEDAGSVQVFYGSHEGLLNASNEIWHQNRGTIQNQCEEHDWFGSAVGAGDINHDGFDDLVIGIMIEDIENIKNAGAMAVIYGSDNALTDAGNEFWFQGMSTSVLENSLARPADFTLEQNFPNPFNPLTAIRYNLPAAGHVLLTVYSVNGETVASLVDRQQPAGSYTVLWNAAHLASGEYFYQIRTDHGQAVRRMVLLK